MKSEGAVTKRPCLGWDEPGGQKQVSQEVQKAKKRCLVFSLFEDRCIFSIEHDNKLVLDMWSHLDSQGLESQEMMLSLQV